MRRRPATAPRCLPAAGRAAESRPPGVAFGNQTAVAPEAIGCRSSSGSVFWTPAQSRKRHCQPERGAHRSRPRRLGPVRPARPRSAESRVIVVSPPRPRLARAGGGRRSRLRPPRPPDGALAVRRVRIRMISNWPSVIVPVLSKTTYPTLAASCSTEPPRTKMPRRASPPMAATMAVGVARMSAQGHATIRTATVRSQSR